MDKLLKEIDSHEVITFDVFDTLLKRPFVNEDDLFYAVGEQLNDIDIDDFVAKRKNADKTARQTFPQKEVNIHEIYMMLYGEYGKEKCERIKQIEIQTEINTALPNMKIYSYYQKCIELKKRIFIISDMYLPGDIIKEILSHIGVVVYEKLYSSCDYRKTKWENGDLFDLCLKENSIKPSQSLHIGDNKRADIDMAKKIGMDAYQVIENGIGLSQYRSYKFITNKKNVKYYSRLKKFIDSSIPNEKSIAFRTGYEIFGPMLCHYIKWLQSIVRLHDIKTILFFSRDGYVLKKAYDLLRDDGVKTKYFYLSRRSIVVALLSYSNSLESFFDVYKSWPKRIKIKHFINRMGLDVEDVEEVLKCYNYKVDDVILYKDVLSDVKFRKFFEEIRPKFISIANTQKVLFQKYFSDMTNEAGKIAIVDIGAGCTIEYALNEFLKRSKINIKLFPCYFLMNDYKEKSGFRKTCYKYNPLLTSVLRFSYMFLEAFLSAPHGTVLSYRRDDYNKVYPVLEPFCYKKNNCMSDSRHILDLQSGALFFVNMFKNNNCEKYILLNQEIVFSGYYEFGLFPKSKDMEFWKEIHFDGDDFEKMVTRKSLIWYIRHPGSLKNDFYKSMWPAAFIKDLFGTNIIVKMMFWMYHKLQSHRG